MKKPWSISTTVRNPERLRDFLRILSQLEGKEWTRENQRKFQIMLIQFRLYGYGSREFYTGLSKEHLELIDSQEPISFKKAEEILDSKDYTGGGDMRGRQSFNPLEKMGLVYLDEGNKVRISAVGKYFLKESYDIGEVFFRSFLKWQLPNPDSDDFTLDKGYNIRPFPATLSLISEVNKKWSKLGNEPVGISRKEFSLFVPTLIDYHEINSYAEKIIELRLSLRKAKDKKKFLESYSKQRVSDFIKSNKSTIVQTALNNLRDYADNIIRYFRLTRYIYIRGNGYYIDLEPRRYIEISGLLESKLEKPLEFKNKKEFIAYLSDISQPTLPWDRIDKLKEIAEEIIFEIKQIEKKLQISEFKQAEYAKFGKEQLHKYIIELRETRRTLQEEEIRRKSQDVVCIEEYIRVLREEIYSMEDRPIVLERYVTLALNALNDALSIRPNYPVGDDDEPTSTAPANEPDIECFYEEGNSICEVTMLNGRSQWYNEGQPVMRHLREFEDKSKKEEVYCLFIAPSLHTDTIEEFWRSAKYEYQGRKQKIIPLSIKQFSELLEILILIKQAGKKLSHKSLFELCRKISDVDKLKNSKEWISKIPDEIKEWKKEVIN